MSTFITSMEKSTEGGNSDVSNPSKGIKRCGYYVKRKRRNCRMLPATGNTYCAEHLCFQVNDLQQVDDEMKIKKRVKCPLDPKHTVFEDRLQKHLEKCNSRGKTRQEYYKEHINSGLLPNPTSDNEKVPLNQISKEEIDGLIDRIKLIYSKSKVKIEEILGYHQVLKEELQNPEYGESTRKHFLQQASLINILDKNGAFRKETAFLELGAGKGKLSHWLQKAVGNVDGVEYYLIDRQNHRHKFDCYHKGDDQGPSFKRLYIDIEHLNLAKVTDLKEKQIVGFGKHLCGGATDLSLRCLVESNHERTEKFDLSAKKAKIVGRTNGVTMILLALCCYHKCSWSSFVGREFFSANGFSSKDFHRITKLCSWAVCGTRIQEKGGEGAQNDESLKDTALETSVWQVGADEKKDIGLKCKRLIDLGRMDYLSRHGFETQLMHYVDSKVTLENVVLLAKPKIC